MRVSGFKPTGHLHLGNYLGAIRPIVDAQRTTDSVAFVADLHALTVTHDPVLVGALTYELTGVLLAAGVDPDVTLLYAQSQVPAHAELHYLLECATAYGEAHRMVQFKEKAGGPGTRLSMLTYPVLMAGDVLLHGADEVPVGDDQRQHLELARDVASRFNAHYGQTFVVPRAVNPQVAARLMDLTDPRAKMGKTSASAAGVLFLLDPPEVLRRKVMRAVTDPGSEISRDPVRSPGIANLMDILDACGGPAEEHRSYAALKNAVADAVIETLRPIRERYSTLPRDEIVRVLRSGAERAAVRTAPTLRRAREAIGLVPA